ncbi:PH domain-containing protein [Natrialba swarupiae]|uniref:PH domain-containing protein n=1 Tax=Natrialba swarupiae TaxID=2448032 RepID=A0A5D5AQX1_9EURY|nr:PH domain-containing protein [Natrialba swarupiae]TYT63315.1 PH domain-containing protein [Natrialba swarupiae]
MATRDRVDAADFGSPDVGFKTAIGFYTGILLAGVLAGGGVLAGVATPTLLSMFPTAVTVTTIVGFVLAGRATGLAERIGERRWRRLACYAPAAAFGAVVPISAATSIDLPSRFLVLAATLFVLTGVLGFDVAHMARSRYVAFLTRDEPTATWSYRKLSALSNRYALMAVWLAVIAGGLASAAVGGRFGLFWAFWGAVMLATLWMDDGIWGQFEPSDRWGTAEMAAHDAGILIETGLSSSLVPWERIDDVRLTDDELVLEQRLWPSLRCDRSVIDDPEAVLEGIDRAREQSRTTSPADPATEPDRRR